ncbi:methyltransferase-like protein 25B isoform X2 [Toxorhynchites rutilus septentrionalis]|uniref:methyltransferase-like protein 25B isoform X2 n=1 Tax=Toxorhynchites rutilus septentrionalis TaxID=329112 RepID=UPI00247AB685|nr:methyltransferase-like protein 25B isoform X2 [Toxorhynchites rutilus septentrionalis]
MILLEELEFTEYFTRCSIFLDEYKWIFQHANTKFVEAGTLDRIPADWIRDMSSASVKEFNEIPFGYINEGWCDDFKKFLLSVRDLSVLFKYVNFLDLNYARLKGIGPKKLYEIENLTAIIANTCKGDEIIWDFGSGLGYLSQNVHLKLRLPVMGIEGDPYRVEASLQRQTKYFPDSINSVKFVQHFIQPDSFSFLEATSTSLLPKDRIPKYALVGLHACADLSVTAIRMFLRNEPITKLIMMPCCYHKLKPENHDCTSFYNIPTFSSIGMPTNIGQMEENERSRA